MSNSLRARAPSLPHAKVIGIVLSRECAAPDLPFGDLDALTTPDIAFDPEAGITLRSTSAARAGRRDADQFAELLGRVRRRDESALKALHDACEVRLLAVAVRIVGRHETACEAVSSAFLQAWQHAEDFDDNRSSVFGWLSMMVRSRALDLLRQSKVRNRYECAVVEFELEAVVGVSPEPCRGVEQSQQRIGLRRAMATLAPVQRQVLSLVFLEGHSHEEAAEQIGLPLGTVKSHSRRGLAALRAHTALRAAHA
jgi:RNA polymerase sigma-70 factor (ECF subfamily)